MRGRECRAIDALQLGVAFVTLIESAGDVSEAEGGNLGGVGDVHPQAGDAGIDVDQILPATEGRDQLFGFGVESHDDLVDALVWLIKGLVQSGLGFVPITPVDTNLVQKKDE